MNIWHVRGQGSEINVCCELIRLIHKTARSMASYTLRAESPSIFLDKLGRGRSLPDLSRKIEGDSARRVGFIEISISN